MAHPDCIGTLQTFDDCLKYSESTVGIVTEVKPVIFTLIIFAVYRIRATFGRSHLEAAKFKLQRIFFERGWASASALQGTVWSRGGKPFSNAFAN